MVDVIGRAKVIVEGTVDTASIGRSGGKIGDVLKKGALVGGAALGTLAAVGVETFKAFEQAEAQSRKLNKVLDNMGESKAGPAVEKLADDLMRLTGIDDEVIKGGQTILATFDSVNDSAGELGGTFERATRLSADMSSVFGSVDSAARILGKALEDPDKAAARLVRSNVILNDEQKKLIQNFVDAGDKAGAQDVILKALEDRYKGTAEASATESQKIATSFGELKENVGSIVADLVNALAGGGKGKKKSLSGSIYELSDAVDKFANSPSWNQLQGQISETAQLIGTIVGPVSKVVDWYDKLQKKSPRLADALKKLIDPLTSIKLGLQAIADAYNAVRDFFDDPPTSADVPDAPDFAGGRASGGPASGWTVVNENGPELIRLPQGSYVYPTGASKDMVAASGGGSVTNINNFYGPENLAEARRNADWQTKYGTRFGAATAAGAL